MVRNHAKSNVFFIGLRCAVFFADRLSGCVYQGCEQVGIIVGLPALYESRYAFKTHAGINVPGGQRRKLAVSISIELDKDKVPDFNYIGVVLVYKRPAGLVGRIIVMNLAARTARAGISHFPEVVFEVSGVNPL